jgi:hypothetical protein
MGANYCPSCGGEVREGTRFCPSCGENIEEGTVKTDSETQGVSEEESSEDETDVKTLLAWGGGALFVILGTLMLVDSVGGGIIMILTGAFILPNVRREMDYNFSTGVVVVVAIVGIVAAGALLPPTDTGTSNVDNTNPSGEASTQQTGHAVRIQYSGDWQGSIATGGQSRSVEGSGTTTYDISGDPFVISANAQKMDGGGGTLTVQILEDGEVVSETSTSASYGVAQTSY